MKYNYNYIIEFLENRCQKLSEGIQTTEDEEKKRIMMAVLREDEKLLQMIKLTKEKEQIEYADEHCN